MSGPVSEVSGKNLPSNPICCFRCSETDGSTREESSISGLAIRLHALHHGRWSVAESGCAVDLQVLCRIFRRAPIFMRWRFFGRYLGPDGADGCVLRVWW